MLSPSRLVHTTAANKQVSLAVMATYQAVQRHAGQLLLLLLVHQALYPLLPTSTQTKTAFTSTAAHTPAGHAEDEPLLDAVRVAVSAHGAGEAVSRRCGRHQAPDGICNGHSRAGCAAAAPLLDQGSTAVCDSGCELLLEPLHVLHDVDGGAAADARVDEVRHLQSGQNCKRWQE